MANEKKRRDKNVEKAVKERLKKTHLSSFRIVGSEADDSRGTFSVYMLRIVDNSNYLFKINAITNGKGGYDLSGLFPLTDSADYGEYRVYNPLPASAEVLKPTDKEKKKFRGYK
ncbi:MAG: hypothetical protein ACOX4R_08665 [Lentihominibacter sp.]